MNYYEVSIELTTTGREEDSTYIQGVVKGKKNYTKKLESLILKTFGDIQYITLDSWCFKSDIKKEVITLYDSSKLYK